MIGICSPYTRSETTLAASMVAATLAASGTSVHWFLEGPEATGVELGWEPHLIRRNQMGKKLAQQINCWIYFALHTVWPSWANKLRTTRHLVFRDWRQYSARWKGPEPSRYVAAEGSQTSFRPTQRVRYDFVQWGAGVQPLLQIPPRANKTTSVLLFLDRFACKDELSLSLRAVDLWLGRGHRVVLVSWNTVSDLAMHHWEHRMEKNPRFEWHRKPSFKQLRCLASDLDCCILPQRSTAYGAWAAFFRSLGLWTVGNATRVFNASLDDSIVPAQKRGNRVLESNVWHADPHRPTALQRQGAYNHSCRIEEQFAEYWNNVWTIPRSSSPS